MGSGKHAVYGHGQQHESFLVCVFQGAAVVKVPFVDMANTMLDSSLPLTGIPLQHIATHCNTLQHTATQIAVHGHCQYQFNSSLRLTDISLLAPLHVKIEYIYI